MSNFAGIERRVRNECESHADRKTQELKNALANMLGYSGVRGYPVEFNEALRPLLALAEERFTEMKMVEVWGDAEKAALDVLKRGVQ